MLAGLLIEVVKRNRRRQLVVVAAAWVNWCLFVGIAILTYRIFW